MKHTFTMTTTNARTKCLRAWWGHAAGGTFKTI